MMQYKPNLPLMKISVFNYKGGQLRRCLDSFGNMEISGQDNN